MRGVVWFDPRTYLKIPFLAPERPRSRSSKLLKSFGSKVRVVHASFAFTLELVDVSNNIAANIYSCSIQQCKDPLRNVTRKIQRYERPCARSALVF